MKKQIFTILLTLISVVGICSPNNVITYKANSKLTETTNKGRGYPGLQINSFGVTMQSHEFNNETKVGTITFEKELTSIGEFAFYECEEMTSVTLPESVTSIANQVFARCSKLESFTFPKKVTNVSFELFFACGALKEVNLPDSSLKSISARAFLACTSLTSITIPEGVVSMENNPFEECTNLTDITVKATTPPVCTDNIGVPPTAILHVPCPSVSAYAEANGWKKFFNIEGYAAPVVVLSADETKGSVGQELISCDTKIYAIPADGYKFTVWNDGNTDNPRILHNVEQALTLVADFEAEQLRPIVENPGMYMKVITKSEEVYEFDTRDIKSVDYHLVTE